MDRERLEAGVASLEAERKELAGKCNLSAIREYRAKEKEYLLPVAAPTALSDGPEAPRRDFEPLGKPRPDAFMAGFGPTPPRPRGLNRL